MKEQVRLGEYNKKSVKKNHQDEVDGKKQEVYTKDEGDAYRNERSATLKEKNEGGGVMVLMMDEE